MRNMTDRDLALEDGPAFAVEPGQHFALVPEWLIFSDVGATPLRVYAALACAWSDWTTGECWPSRRTVAERLGVSIDTVDRALAKLAEHGAVRIEERRRPDGSRASNRVWILRTPAPTPPQECGHPDRTDAATPSADSRPHELEPRELAAGDPRANTRAGSSDAVEADPERRRVIAERATAEARAEMTRKAHGTPVVSSAP